MNDFIDYRVTTHGKVLTVTKIATTDAYQARMTEALRGTGGPFLSLLRWLRIA